MIFQVSSFRKLWIFGLVLLIPKTAVEAQPGSHHVTSSIFDCQVDSQFVLICPFPNGYTVDV